jgi:hypothetical protein
MIKVQEIQVGSIHLSVVRPHLKRWLELEQIKSRERADRVEMICHYLSAFLDWTDEQLEQVGWVDALTIYSECLKVNSPKLNLSFMQFKEEKTRVEPWDYPERWWYSFAHMLAQSYGWTLDTIAELDVDDALALVQEVLLDEQFKREWEWSLTEIAYPYDKGSKKSIFHPLERPAWMYVKKEIRKTRIPARMLPVGNVIGMPDETTELP